MRDLSRPSEVQLSGARSGTEKARFKGRRHLQPSRERSKDQDRIPEPEDEGLLNVTAPVSLTREILTHLPPSSLTPLFERLKHTPIVYAG